MFDNSAYDRCFLRFTLDILMTHEEIQAARAVINAATPGSWKVFGERPDCADLYIPGAIAHNFRPKENAVFIAAARTGWPQALDEIERLSACLDVAREAATQSADYWCEAYRTCLKEKLIVNERCRTSAAREKVLVEALEWYAENYTHIGDGGNKARAALTERGGG